ncbi:MAG: MATE family efflux transporter [Bulleidia sp.]
MEKKKSLFGSVDLLHGPILPALVAFMIPVFISYLFQQLYNAVDTALVGNLLGTSSLAAVGACASVFEFMVGFMMSLGNGFSIVIARAFGSGDHDRMRKSISVSIVIGLLTTAVFTLFSMVGMEWLLKLIDTPAEILGEAMSYIQVIGAGVIVMFLYNYASGILRAIGNSVMPLVFLVFSSLLNIILDYAFMKWFGMGVAGAALATVVSQGVSAVGCIGYILTKEKELVPSRKDFVFDGELVKDLAGQGYSMAFMGSIVSIGSIILQSGINGLGTEIIAGHVAARKVYAIMNLPFMAMSMAISTFVSQNKGSNQGKRILSAMKTAYIFDVIAAVVISAIMWVTAPAMIHLISGSDSPVILANGSRFLYVVAPFYAVLGVLIQTRFALQGIGSKFLPLISSVIECVGKIIFTFFLIPVFHYEAVIWCEPVIWCVMTVELLISFFTNPYIKEVRKHA